MQQKPICFTSLQVSSRSEACTRCPHRAACVEGAYTFLDTWKGSPIIDAERQRIALVAQEFKKSEPKPALAIEGSRPAATPLPLPAKKLGNAAVKRATARSEKSGKFALYARELAAGRNPGKKDWEKVFFDLLLKGNMTREKLVRTYICDPRTGYTPGTAKTRACTAIAMFQEALFIRCEEAAIELHPHLSNNTIRIDTCTQQ